MTFIPFVTGKSSRILSDISSGILSGISSGILPGISFDILSGISSGILPDILSGILSGKSSGVLSGKHSGTLSGIPSGILSGILSGIPSGILSGISPGISSGILSGTFYLAYLLAFYLAYLLAYVLALARTKRRTQNARSGTHVPNAGGVLVVLWIPEASPSFFCSLQQGSAASHRKFQQCFKVFLHYDKICERSESFPFREKKDPGRKANLPHKPGEARTFFASPKKGSGVGKINFLVASYNILSP